MLDFSGERQKNMLLKIKKTIFHFVCFILLIGFSSAPPAFSFQATSETSILELLKITPSAASLDFIKNRSQFFQAQLTTERRHSKTLNFSQIAQEDLESALRQLLSVEEDIEKKLVELSQSPETLLKMVGAIETAILEGNRIYIYGSGASGRLALQMECAFWRPFWERIKSTHKLSDRLHFLKEDPIEDRLIGEITGGDRALLGSLDSLEDLLLMGWLQLQERGIKRGDVVICLSEGGETPAVIGTLQAALDLWKSAPSFQSKEASQKLFFIYNNPDDELYLFDRSRNILEEPGITKVNLTTGPQGITGSTRLQASTINTLVLGHILQAALFRCLERGLSKKEMARIGFADEFVLPDQLTEYSSLLREIDTHLSQMADYVRLETEVYSGGGFATFFGQKGFIPVLNSISGQAPDFHLAPLDSVESHKRKSKTQLWTGASGSQAAWEAVLGRPFRGLTPAVYQKPIADVVADPYLKDAARECLKKTGSDQAFLYDFSMSADHLILTGPSVGDLGVCVLISPEEPTPEKERSDIARFMRIFREDNRHLAILWIANGPERKFEKTIQSLYRSSDIQLDVFLPVHISSRNDPLGINQQVALKLLLDTHSTAVMGRLGKITGNYSTHLCPANFKLLGRSTHILQSLVNDTLKSPRWVERYGIGSPITFGEANAILLANRDELLKNKSRTEQISEIALSVIQILESVRSRQGLPHEKALSVLVNQGLNRYLTVVLK
jgi:N-acetylmuramic acid 6-phosphate etherase